MPSLGGICSKACIAINVTSYVAASPKTSTDSMVLRTAIWSRRIPNHLGATYSSILAPPQVKKSASHHYEAASKQPGTLMDCRRHGLDAPE
ncbi:uncharacterized protein DMAD_13520 [Drosophila madeirensis]|uniref:Uncharacterized protein n=1 Tax=Drosophila madeirensis TaxID=30013 RepID=A0AAU9FKY0_DROMD